MARFHSDGNKFQEELEKAAAKATQPIYTMRLRTPQARQANVRNIADFILFGRHTAILEVKETSDKAFSLFTFQQKEEIDKFKEFFEKAIEYYGFKNDYPYRVAVLVHFLKQKKFTLYYVDDAPYVVMHPDDENCLTWESLKEAIEYIVQQ